VDWTGQLLLTTPLTKLSNIVSVESRNYSPGGPGGPPPERSDLPPAPICVSNFSTLGASVGAIGNRVHTLAGVSPPEVVDDANGTSFASPQAAAAAAWI